MGDARGLRGLHGLPVEGASGGGTDADRADSAVLLRAQGGGFGCTETGATVPALSRLEIRLTACEYLWHPFTNAGGANHAASPPDA